MFEIVTREDSRNRRNLVLETRKNTVNQNEGSDLEIPAQTTRALPKAGSSLGPCRQEIDKKSGIHRKRNLPTMLPTPIKQTVIQDSEHEYEPSSAQCWLDHGSVVLLIVKSIVQRTHPRRTVRFAMKLNSNHNYPESMN